jgi:hypothetical protein
MDDYNFWADLLDAFQSSPDWIKALWLLIPPGFSLALIAMLIRYRLISQRIGPIRNGELVYSVHRRSSGDTHIVSHTHDVDGPPPLPLLEKPASDPYAQQCRSISRHL